MVGMYLPIHMWLITQLRESLRSKLCRDDEMYAACLQTIRASLTLSACWAHEYGSVMDRVLTDPEWSRKKKRCRLHQHIRTHIKRAVTRVTVADSARNLRLTPASACHLSENRTRWNNDVLMLGQRLRSWTNIKTSLFQLVPFAGTFILCCYHVGPES